MQPVRTPRTSAAAFYNFLICAERSDALTIFPSRAIVQFLGIPKWTNHWTFDHTRIRHSRESVTHLLPHVHSDAV